MSTNATNEIDKKADLANIDEIHMKRTKKSEKKIGKISCRCNLMEHKFECLGKYKRMSRNDSTNRANTQLIAKSLSIKTLVGKPTAWKWTHEKWLWKPWSINGTEFTFRSKPVKETPTSWANCTQTIRSATSLSCFFLIHSLRWSHASRFWTNGMVFFSRKRKQFQAKRLTFCRIAVYVTIIKTNENHNVLFFAFDLKIFYTLILTRHVLLDTQSVYLVAAKKISSMGLACTKIETDVWNVEIDWCFDFNYTIHMWLSSRLHILPPANPINAS